MAEERINYENGQRLFFAKVFGKEISFRYPISVNQLALMEYNPEWTIDMIVLFEKMLVFYKSRHLKPFTYQLWRLRKELHLTPDRLNNARAELQKLNILGEHNPGRGKKIEYSIRKEKIIELLPSIYRMPSEDAARSKLISELTEFYNYFLSSNYEYAVMAGIDNKRVNIITTVTKDVEDDQSGNIDSELFE